MNLLKYFKKPITVVTHNGSFHADDVFACATLSIWADKEDRRIKIIRTRDPKIIEKADIVVDVGGIYDPQTNRFDHHQKGGAGSHPNNIPYASFGLVWKHFGNKICDETISETIRIKLVTPIDAIDNGVNIYTVNEFGTHEYSIGDAINAIKDSEDENELKKLFINSIQIAKSIITGEINKTQFKIDGEKITIGEIEKQNNPEILILEKYASWSKAVQNNKNTKLVIYPDRNKKDWCIEVARDDVKNYNSNRIKFPEDWAGLRGQELEGKSEINGAVFCHNGRFFAIANSKEGALAMARKALVWYNGSN